MATSVTHAPGICSRRLNAVLTRTWVVLWLRFGVVTPKPRATPRARPSFHPRTTDGVAPQQKPALTSTKAPTKTRGAPYVFETATADVLVGESLRQDVRPPPPGESLNRW